MARVPLHHSQRRCELPPRPLALVVLLVPGMSILIIGFAGRAVATAQDVSRERLGT